MYRLIYIVLCVATPLCSWVQHGAVIDTDSLQHNQGAGPYGIDKSNFVFGPMHRGDSEIRDTWHFFLTTDGAVHIANSHIMALDAQGAITIDGNSQVDDADISGMATVNDATLTNMDCHGVADISKAHIHNLMVHGPTDVCDSFIGYANISSMLRMARCYGTSCALFGGVNMYQSQYGDVSIDVRHASKRDYPLHVSAGTIQRLYVYANKKDDTTLYVSDSYLGRINADAQLQMTGCRGKSCSVAGAMNIDKSEYGDLTVNTSCCTSEQNASLAVKQSKISKLRISGDKKACPILHAYDSNIGSIDARSGLEMARCSGTSCSTMGCVDMHNSAYDNLTIDARHASSLETFAGVAQSSVAKLRMYGDGQTNSTLHLSNSFLNHIDVVSDMRMEWCYGASCAVAGDVDMRQSEYDDVKIDMRRAHKRDYSVYITQSSTPRIQVRTNKRVHPKIYVYEPRQEVHVQFRGHRGTVVTDAPHMVTVNKGDVSEYYNQ